MLRRPTLPLGPFLGASVAGGTFIAVGDHLFHVRTDVLEHHWYPQAGGQTLLVFPIFMAAAALMLGATAALVAPEPRPTWARAGVAALAFYAAYALTGALGTDHPALTLGLLTAAFLARLAFEPDRRAVVLVGVLIALGGCLGEAAISDLGLFTYAHTDVAGVPLWLVPLYLNGAPAVVALARLVQPETTVDATRPDAVPVASAG